MDPGLRRQVGHWKRVAQTLWSEKPAAAPLEMEVSFYGPEMGSRGPSVHLRSGSRSETVAEPITEAKVAAALGKVRDGAGAASLKLPPDDSEARLSPNGQWTAMISWRGSGPEVWLAQRDAHNVVRVAFPGSERLVDRVMVTEPRWSANGQILAWIQGGRVVIYDVGRRVGRVVSPAGKQAVDFWWSPHPASPMIARYVDGTVDLLDLSREAAVPLSDILRDSAATGSFYWSPSGNKVLFPIQGRIVTADLESPGGALATIQRTLDRFLGMPAGPKSENGPNEDRLAVLDIADHRLDAFSVRGTPLETAPAAEVSWSLNEDLVYAVSGASGEAAEPEGEGGGAGGASSLIRFPLAQGQKPSTVLASPQPIHCLGPATDVLPSEKMQAHPPARLQFLAGNRVLVIQDGNPPSTKEPYTAEQIRRFTLRPGPEGGYRGVESDAITQDEPGLWTVFTPLLEGQGAGTRVLLPGGVFAVTALGPEMGSRIEKEIASGSLVGLDLYPGSRHSVFAVGSSPTGGAGTVGILTPGLDTPGEIHDDPVSRRMSEEQVEVVTPLTEAFHVVDAHSGLVRMSEGYQSATILRLILGGLVLVVAFGAILTLKRRLQKG